MISRILLKLFQNIILFNNSTVYQIKCKIYKRYKNSNFLETNKQAVIVGHSSGVDFRKLFENRSQYFIITTADISDYLKIVPDLIVYGEDTQSENIDIEQLRVIKNSVSKKYKVFVPVKRYKYLSKCLQNIDQYNVFTHPKVSFRPIDVRTINIGWSYPLLSNIRHTELMIMLAICCGATKIHIEGCNTDFLGLYLDRLNLRHYHFFDSDKFRSHRRPLEITSGDFTNFLDEQTDVLKSIFKLSEFAIKNNIKLTTNLESFLSFIEIRELN